MHTVNVRNVHAALPEALHLLNWAGVDRDSRNGPVVYLPTPVTTVYERPRERVIFWPERDANPFFHLYEALWMLGGRCDVDSLTRFVKRIADYSDDGVVFHGAYGYRWRRHFGLDQLATIATRLADDFTDRRQVLTITDPRADLGRQKDRRDIPCNLAATFQIHYGVLDMVVFNRSNDIIWGAYGANAVHFSMLQEVMAAWIGVPVGKYWQVSANFHAYRSVLAPLECLADRRTMPPDPAVNPYDEFHPSRVVNSDIDTWFGDLEMFLSEGTTASGYRDVFFRKVAVPMVRTHELFKQKRYLEALSMAHQVKAPDWRKAAMEWLMRRSVYKLNSPKDVR